MGHRDSLSYLILSCPGLRKIRHSSLVCRCGFVVIIVFAPQEGQALNDKTWKTWKDLYGIFREMDKISKL